MPGTGKDYNIWTGVRGFMHVRNVLAAFATLATLTWAVTPASAANEKTSQILLQKLTKPQYLDMLRLGLDIVQAGNGEYHILAKPADLQSLGALGIPFQVEEPDVEAFYASRYQAAVSMGGFRTYSQIVAYLDTLTLLYPAICSPKFSIGNSIQGRPQWVVKISSSPAMDNGTPEVFYNSLIHAREPAGAAALLNIMSYLLSNYGTDALATSIVNTRQLYFLPVFNPDGYAYNEQTNPSGSGMWRKNRRFNNPSYGVDLNRNWGFDWGYDDYGSSPSANSEVYRGTGPFSEIETQNVSSFIQAHHFVICENFHTYSNLVLWPYGQDRIYTAKDDFFRNLGDSMTKFNGYTPEVSWTLYPTNGAADDWMWGDTISKKRIISVTTEIGGSGDGFWPPVSRIPALIAENLMPNLFLAKIADNPYIIGPPDPPSIATPDSAGSAFHVSWKSRDSINTPVAYSLYELTGKKTVVDSAEIDRGYWNTSLMALSTTRKHSGASSWKSTGGDAANCWLLGKNPYLVKANDSLVFWMWYDIEADWDYFYAQVSLDGGFTFINLKNALSSTTNPNNMNYGNGITGTSTTWVRAAFDLSAFTGKQVIVRLSYFTDGAVTREGVYLDDIVNVDAFAGETLVASGIVDTFFAFTSKPDGNYWYRVTGTDAQNQTSRKSTLTSIHVKKPYIVGDVTADGTIDISDVMALVDFLMSVGPAPVPYLSGDTDCSGTIDISDVMVLIDFLSGLGPQPSCP